MSILWYYFALPRIVPHPDGPTTLMYILNKTVADTVLYSWFGYARYLYAMTIINGGSHE